MISFRKPKMTDAQMILNWRTKPEITRYQYTDVSYDLERQKTWLQKQIDKPGRCDIWVIQSDDTPIGLLKLENNEPLHRRTSWGYYIGELDYWIIGGHIPPYFYNYLFYKRELGLEKVMAEVISENTNVIKMHTLHGYRIVGTFEKHILKNNTFYDVTFLELHRQDWDSRQNQYGRFEATFEE